MENLFHLQKQNEDLFAYIEFITKIMMWDGHKIKLQYQNDDQLPAHHACTYGTVGTFFFSVRGVLIEYIWSKIYRVSLFKTTSLGV